MKCAEEDKNAIVARFQQGEPAKVLCAECGISRSTLYRWSKLYCIAHPTQNRNLLFRSMTRSSVK